METTSEKGVMFLAALSVGISAMFIASFASPTQLVWLSQQTKPLLQLQGVQGAQGVKSTEANTTSMNIILVHGAWADGSSWNKVISILEKAGHRVIAVQLPLHSLANDIATVKRAIDLVGGPVTLVGHSYGGAVITNAAYNNPNVTGLVYIAAFAPDEG